MDTTKIGSWAFIIGVIIAVIVGALVGVDQGAMLGDAAGYVPLVLVILGLVVGFINIGDKEVNDFLLAAIVLIAIGIASNAMLQIDVVLAPLGSILQGILNNVAVFVAPAALVVALKAVYNMGKTPAVV